MGLSVLPAALRRSALCQQIEQRRRRARSAYEPFPMNAGEPDAGEPDAGGPGQGLPDAGEPDVGPRADPLVRLLHDGIAIPGGIPDDLAEDLAAAGLIAEAPTTGTPRSATGRERIRPGRWQVTAFRGLFAVRDRPTGPAGARVYLGEDSLRFVETILDVAPGGRALDVGTGSGITACALARGCERVVAVDVVEECLHAAAVSASLNGMGPRVVPVHSSLAELGAPRATPGGSRFTCVAANLPYVPVPPSLAYSPAGDGGPDGLGPIRQLLRRAGELLDPDTGTLLLRFQGLAGDRGPLLLRDLRAFARRHHFDVLVVADGRVPYEVRAALTALLAGPLDPTLTPAEIHATTRAHLAAFCRPHFLACAVVATAGGGGRVEFVDLSNPPLLDRVVVPRGPVSRVLAARERIVAGYWHGVRDLPDGFWELATTREVLAPVTRFEPLVRALGDGACARDAAERVCADLFAADPVRAQSLLVTVELLVQQLVRARLMAPTG